MPTKTAIMFVILANAPVHFSVGDCQLAFPTHRSSTLLGDLEVILALQGKALLTAAKASLKTELPKLTLNRRRNRNIISFRYPQNGANEGKSAASHPTDESQDSHGADRQAKMVNVLKGVLVECDPTVKQFLLHLDEKNILQRKFIIEDLDETHVFVSADIIPLLQEKLWELMDANSFNGAAINQQS